MDIKEREGNGSKPCSPATRLTACTFCCDTCASSYVLSRCQTIDKAGQLLWAWFSCPRELLDKVVEPRHTADFIVCNFVQYQLASRNANRKVIPALFFSESSERI